MRGLNPEFTAGRPSINGRPTIHAGSAEPRAKSDIIRVRPWLIPGERTDLCIRKLNLQFYLAKYSDNLSNYAMSNIV
jgi:hypothetical protein